MGEAGGNRVTPLSRVIAEPSRTQPSEHPRMSVQKKQGWSFGRHVGKSVFAR